MPAHAYHVVRSDVLASMKAACPHLQERRNLGLDCEMPLGQDWADMHAYQAKLRGWLLACSSVVMVLQLAAAGWCPTA